MIRLRLVFQDGFRLWKTSQRLFLTSIPLIPRMLWFAMTGRFSAYIEQVEDGLFRRFARDMPDFKRELFSQNPEAYSLATADRFTAMIWFAPGTRYAMTYRLAHRLGRFWAWSEGSATGPP